MERWQLKLKLKTFATETRTSLTFKVGKREAGKSAARFTSIRLVKQEDFCGAIALTYFAKKLLRFTLTVFKERKHL